MAKAAKTKRKPKPRDWTEPWLQDGYWVTAYPSALAPGTWRVHGRNAYGQTFQFYVESPEKIEPEVRMTIEERKQCLDSTRQGS